MPKPAPQTIEAVYEGGVFKPFRKVPLPDHSRVRLTLDPLPRSVAEKTLGERQRKALLAVVGIGSSGRADISERHDEHLYGKKPLTVPRPSSLSIRWRGMRPHRERER